MKNRTTDMKKVNLMYFSPTATTKTVVEAIGKRLVDTKGLQRGLERGKTIDFTLPKQRESAQNFQTKDILVIGVPVYAGRVPNVLLKYLNTIQGNNTLAIPIVLYGNRHYDDALLELNDILQKNGFKVIAGAAFIGEHSFSYTLAKERPDNKDLTIAEEFANKVYTKIQSNNHSTAKVNGSRPYRPYYMPKNEEDELVDIRRVVPKTNDTCIDCKICSEVCPMGSIPYNDVKAIVGICIKCGACIKRCPTQSKYFDDTDYLRHKQELEEQFVERREPELFV